MGIPKFFRWISERYPMCSQLITEKRVPEFDNLYLDMNGIIHNCTHMDENKREIPENEAFLAIFKYIEHIFGTIKPKKLFFLAVDGVAPRAKMNQQRSRRFRAAKEAYEFYQEKINKGEEVPKEPFDSNCITPGTIFMKKLSEQLKYFINRKVSEDANWKEIDIIFSGHEVPGEGEHKIMEYIRLSKAQPNYEPNLRHCLYGLDADLIMLGLLSHDPHFCLLREEVLFGPLKKKKQELEEQNFYLMHLCLLREYLEMEFQELKSIDDFPYNFEKILDDFILLAFFVGNDFLPNLPKLHINEGALALVFKIYKEVIPKAKGYINNSGVINLKHLALILEGLEKQEREDFKAHMENKSWVSSKKKEIGEETCLVKKKTLTMTSNQKELFLKMEEFLIQNLKKLDFSPTLSTADRYFVSKMADDFHVKCEKYTLDNKTYLSIEPYSSSEIQDMNKIESIITKELDRYKNSIILDNEESYFDKENEAFEEKWLEWKNSYYIEKLGFSINDTEKLREMAENYIQGLQWVLFYYYRGVCSWSWFYKYHYSPKVSDIKRGFDANLSFNLDSPFKPFEQLMAVLPKQSRKLIPKIFSDLMDDETSPIRDFYPENFELDMNDKKASWEAIVKIPFIEEERLLKAMKIKESLLTDEEKKRNSFGYNLKYSYDENLDYIYLPFIDIFPIIPHCHCKEEVYKLPEILGVEQLVHGLCKGVNLGNISPAGFPSLNTLPHTGHLDNQRVNVFKSESKNESMIITIQNQLDSDTIENFLEKKIGKRVFVGWPYLHEARVNAVSTEQFRYEYLPSSENSDVIISKTLNDSVAWKKSSLKLELNYKKYFGLIINTIKAIVHVSMLKGLRTTEDGALEKDYEPCNSENSEYPLQLVLNEVAVEDTRYIEKPPLDIKQEYPLGSRGFFLGKYNYGRPLEITAHKNGKIDCWIATQTREPDFGKLIYEKFLKDIHYYPSYVASKMAGLSGLVFSKILSSFYVMVDNKKVDLGLNLKYEAKKIKVLGYSRKTEKGWEYTQNAINLAREYKERFPDFIHSIQLHLFDDIPLINKLIPNDNYKEKVKDIRSWLKMINEKNNFERATLDVEQLDKLAIQTIEKELDKIAKNISLFTPKRINNVPRNAILKPSQCELRLHDQEFSLGDRVIYVHDSGKVPIATKGVIVKTGKKVIDIIFDVPFMSGTTLGGKCSAYRGLSVETHFVLNLTKQALLVSTKPLANKKYDKIKSNDRVENPGILPSQSIYPFQKNVYSKPFQTVPQIYHYNSENQSLNTSLKNNLQSHFQNIPKPHHLIHSQVQIHSTRRKIEKKT
ncbi:hypothetical protein PNEG_01528 [Pneumocystis murina B123]|uniref:5'-3' exoribonuclease 1 n=1 Tax=Pneumocystis murina (strain B123) TaxID=1069680 RepID=M7NSN6_PNEMU|nr:hypothetical protein PNEG_01528 [Pneumocystis murina B123]EMR10262.1 hypothetical protein PNEG_01528 [Pneumocystis murina B123]